MTAKKTKNFIFIFFLFLSCDSFFQALPAGNKERSKDLASAAAAALQSAACSCALLFSSFEKAEQKKMSAAFAFSHMYQRKKKPSEARVALLRGLGINVSTDTVIV